jgi:2-oxoglutarate ferredoxin oxidoreductase subunit delta
MADYPRIDINPEQCKSCERCVSECPVICIEITGKFNTHGYHPAQYKGEGCTGCGICFYVCPEPGAITVYKKGYVPEPV